MQDEISSEIIEWSSNKFVIHVTLILNFGFARCSLELWPVKIWTYWLPYGILGRGPRIYIATKSGGQEIGNSCRGRIWRYPLLFCAQPPRKYEGHINVTGHVRAVMIASDCFLHSGSLGMSGDGMVLKKMQEMFSKRWSHIYLLFFVFRRIHYT